MISCIFKLHLCYEAYTVHIMYINAMLSVPSTSRTSVPAFHWNMQCMSQHIAKSNCAEEGRLTKIGEGRMLLEAITQT